MIKYMEKQELKIAVCDDEQAHRERLSRMIEKQWEDGGASCRVFSFSSGDALLKAERAEGFGLIFLDILMREQDGLQTARKLRAEGSRAAVVFVTVSPDFVFRGYEVEAFRYLMKPCSEEQIGETLRAFREKRMRPDELAVRSKGALHKIPMQDILYIEAQRKTSAVVLDGRRLPASAGISELEQELPAEIFFRCQKSFIVNLRQIARISRYEAVLKNGAAVPVSRVKWTELRERLLGYLSR